MTSPKREGLPTFWVTGLAKALTGENPCLLRPYLSAHYKIDKQPRKDDGALAKWKVEHTAMLHAEADRLRADGWTVRAEQFFRLQGTTAIVSGKPDLVAQKPDCRPKIIDLKSGEARESDQMQVLVYQVLIPKAWQSPKMLFDGEVVYRDHRVPLKAAAVEGMQHRLFDLIKHLAIGHQPAPHPSADACRFCEVSSADCADRWQDEHADVLVSEF